MARLLRRFRRKALQVAPEPSGRSGHLPKGQSHLSVPAGGEAAPMQARRRKFPAFWRTRPAPGAGAELGEAPTKPRCSWLRMRFCGQDPAQEGRRAGRLWGLLCGQQRPQEPSPHSQQGASPCPGSEDLSAPSDQEVEDPSTSTIGSARDSSSAWGSSSSDASGRCCIVPGTPTESAAEEWLEMTTEEAALKVIREQLQGRDKDEGQQLRFLRAIYPACLAAQDRGQDTLEPHCCKAAVVERIVELIEELPKDSPPSAILASCLAAVGNLSTMKPALEPELESRLLRAALGSVFSLGTETDATDIQAPHKVMPELLDAVLGNLLAESPDADRLHFILEHVNRWIVSRVPQERARAIKSSTALLRFAVTLPEFDISAEFPRLGQHVAQLALFVSYPDEDISQQAMEGTYRLYQLLLEQRGLSIHEVEDLWCHDWYSDSRLLGYKNTARVGEVFGKFFSAGQRKCFLKTAVPAIYAPLLGISQAGLLLTYAILGEAEQLLGYTLEDITAKLMGQLRSIRQLHQVPEVLQGLGLP
ncbi:maestro heat-like repeat-containing protein family member 7 isoform X1 [Mauremys mutica]|uniref:maestro heat-like repeat-containing protein family member 7 isoform X1 n=2 Tax=Mauremys mutica TaxID=74926 RepID=UPI001D15AAC4|nr:maestro heat-like repeat-containing protein family member 7 isoform X1 [Mauremys mutica]